MNFKATQLGIPTITLATGLPKIISLMLFLAGVLAVLFIIIGGLRYIMSNGDPKATGAAKDTILYAIIGLVITTAAFAIVSFISKRI